MRGYVRTKDRLGVLLNYEAIDEEMIIKMTDYELIAYIRDYCNHLLSNMAIVDTRNRPEYRGSVR